MPDTRTVKKIFKWKPLTKRSQGKPKYEYRWEKIFKRKPLTKRSQGRPKYRWEKIFKWKPPNQKITRKTQVRV